MNRRGDTDNLSRAIKRIRRFRDARQWMQFHNPKNLACSIAIEAAELLEHFQWKTPRQSSSACKEMPRGRFRRDC